jgi:hypothetical protein
VFHVESDQDRIGPSGLSPRDAQFELQRTGAKKQERVAVVLAKKILTAMGYSIEEAHVRPFRRHGQWYVESADFWKCIDLMGKANRVGLYPRFRFVQVTDLFNRSRKRMKIEDNGPWFSDGERLEVEVWAWDKKRLRFRVDRLCPLGWQLAVLTIDVVGGIQGGRFVVHDSCHVDTNKGHSVFTKSVTSTEIELIIDSDGLA